MVVLDLASAELIRDAYRAEHVRREAGEALPYVGAFEGEGSARARRSDQR